jgi:hypothetical protein
LEGGSAPRLGLIGLADSIVIVETNQTFLQVKPAAMIHLIRRLSRHPQLQSASGFESATRGEDTAFLPSEEARQKAGYLSRSIEAKNWE